MKKSISPVSIGVAVLFMAAIISYFVMNKSSKEEIQMQCNSGVVWTTEYNIKYMCDRDLGDSIIKVFNALDVSISPFNSNSIISKINDNKLNKVDEYFIRLYKASKAINKESEGAFDPTVSPLVNAWGFGYKSGNMPDSSAVDSMRKFVGINKTSLKGDIITKEDSRTSFNFSAIAKGMASDEVGRMLERNGVKNYMVEIGGEIALRGINDRGSKWHISVDMPAESHDSVIHNSALLISLSDCGVATSGNYRNYKVVDGHKVAHTINPTTGYPEITNLLSATIIAPDCMTADAYATTCMVMGVERSKILLNSHKELAGMLIIADKDGKITKWKSSRFEKLVVK
ncbi:MAG: FAD:protein FMN transferase [Muribaculaceae bacterium]